MARERETWVDTAKGIAILCVVLFHAVIFMADVDLAWRWREVSNLLDTFRMPLFFFTAGLFAAKVLAQPFRVLLHRRIAPLIWLYVLWSALWTAAFQVIPWVRPEQAAPSWGELAVVLLWPNTSTWFVYALALFFAVTWVARELPWWAHLGPALVLSLLFGRVDTGNQALDKMGMYYLFFALAVRFGPRVRELAPRLGARHALVLVPGYIVLAVGVTVTGTAWVPGVRPILSLVAIVAGVAAAVALSRVPSAAWLTTLGRNTLPVYLLHFYPILGTAAVLAPHRGAVEPWAVLVPPVLTVVAVVVALLVHRATRRVPGLYERPRWLDRALAPREPVVAERA